MNDDEAASHGSPQAVFQRMADAVVAVDTTLYITYLDDQALAYVDRPATEILGEAVADVDTLFTPDAIDALETALTTQTQTTFTYTRPDAGAPRRARAYPDDGGVSILFTDDVVATPDANQPRRPAQIIENLPVAVGQTHPGREGRFSYVNDALVEMFDAASKAAIKSHAVSDLYVDPDDRQALNDRLQVDGHVDAQEVQFRTLDGEQFWGAITATLGEIDGREYILKIITDITAEKARREELRKKTRALEEAPVGISLSDPTQPDNPMTYVNASFTALTGYTEEEALGVNCRFLQGAETEQEPVDAMRAAIENCTSTTVELLNYRKDGTPFWNQVTVAPVEDDSGTVTNFVGFQKDVTDRKAYERRLQEQRDDLEVLNQMMRHDIRNDLQLVVAYVEMLADHVDEEGREYVSTALESAHDAVDLTKTARDMAEVMLQTDIDQTEVNLARVISRQLEKVRATYSKAAITVEGTLPQGDVVATEMLDSVIRNLLTNAIQHNDKEIPQVTLTATTDADGVVVRVADNGPGVPDDRKDAIFGKGERGLDSRGTGIGLYLVRTLVEDYGGDVWVEDNDPEGAVFAIRLRRAD